MKSVKMRWLLILSVIILLSACAGVDESPLPTGTTGPVAEANTDAADSEASEAEESESETQAIDPAALFSSKCSGCHGADRSGDRGPSLLPDRLAKESAQYAETITNGRGGMPSWKGKLSMDEINALAEWILTTPE